ncbi:hypothetical protein DUNSADRAFT_11211 [Dunaliella salina]|uniref:Encoded protein n=1 Tax=Dunaliella salina TaxID=3046 RepID=A0ABQ7GDW7_DUNSA|nr:hypothetical protein DUNSADRAFT_11211 [Dunaliella salina]|eukprot:KAF5832802.1 hypothetical protein DUNSADRAFT_11211 [Dunaliella salina]
MNATFEPEHLLGPFIGVLVLMTLLVAILVHMQKVESTGAPARLGISEVSEGRAATRRSTRPTKRPSDVPVDGIIPAVSVKH